ncbi:MAG: hypothetical protein ACOYWZ_23075 [Bacillota bacterium]
MILRRRFCNTYNRLIAKIRKDLVTSLQRKGVHISQIHVDLRQDNVKLRLCMREE